jgi:hypothetical protein
MKGLNITSTSTSYADPRSTNINQRALPLLIFQQHVVSIPFDRTSEALFTLLQR